MAASSILVTAGEFYDAFTQAGGNKRQAFVLGDAAGAQTVAVDASGALTHRPAVASTGTLTSVASAIASTSLLAANVNRLGGNVYNASTAILYLALNAAASTTSYTLQIPANSNYVLPNGYTGAVSGIWAAANGFARVTEITA